MGQIKVEKNVGGIEGLAVITQLFTVMIVVTSWKLLTKET